jgi:hypothetical protein
MADDDDTPRRSRTGKKRFQERRDRDGDEDADRPRKKRPADDDEDDARDPRVKASDGPPVVLLLALVGGALLLTATCVVGGWWSWVAVVGGGDFGGDEFEITQADRQLQGNPVSGPFIIWAVAAKREHSTRDGQYYLMMKCGDQSAKKLLQPNGGKGWKASGSGLEPSLKGSSGRLEVWVEKRRTPVATDGKVVSNRVVVP